MARENEVSKIFIICLIGQKRKKFNSNSERVDLTDACQRTEMREFHCLSEIVSFARLTE